MFRQVLKKSIQTAIGHQPDDAEFQTMMDYIEGTFSDMEQDGKQMDLTAMELAIYDCRKDCFVECEECGEYFLPTSDEWNSYAHCCRECKPYQDPDMMPGGHDWY